MKGSRMGVIAVLSYVILMGSLPVLAQQSDVYAVYANGMRVSGAHPLIRDGVAYLPVNTLAQALGVSIGWDASLNVVKINGQIIAARPLNDNGTVMLPVEAVAQALNGSVEWDGRNQAIRITTGRLADAPPAPGPAPAVTPTRVRPVTVQTGPVRVSSVPVVVGQTTSVGVPPMNAGSVTPVGTVSVTPTYSNRPIPVAVGSASVQPSSYSAPTPSHVTPVKVPVGGDNGAVYVPKSTQNNVFAVTVTNIEVVSSIKDYYRPRPGNRFVIVYLSQQNVSNEVQIYTGRFSLLDQNNRQFDYVEGLSNFWLVILRPYGINFGYLVFEIPNDAQPSRLALHALNQSPLTLNL